jgi:hypothetical protein
LWFFFFSGFRVVETGQPQLRGPEAVHRLHRGEALPDGRTQGQVAHVQDRGDSGNFTMFMFTIQPLTNFKINNFLKVATFIWDHSHFI